jgi:hypothetical protein
MNYGTFWIDESSNIYTGFTEKVRIAVSSTERYFRAGQTTQPAVTMARCRNANHENQAEVKDKLDDSWRVVMNENKIIQTNLGANNHSAIMQMKLE